MRPTAIHHVSIDVDDVEAAERFYVDVLGMTRRDDRPDFGVPGVWLDCGGQQVHLIGGTTPAGGGQHFAIAVDDLDATVDELRAVGVVVSDPRPVGAARQVFLRDPAGNLVEIQSR